MSELNSFVTYIQSLEQRLAALEARIDELQASISELEARPVAVAQVEEEPEVEVELIMEDDTEPEAVAEPAVEPVVESELIVEPEPAPEPVVEEPVVEPIAEPVAEPEPVVEKPHAPVQTSLFGPSVTDIRHAISLGDRFLFQRELFGGKGELMQKTLDTLNQMNSLNEAVSYINSKFKWDMDSTTYELFLNILRRRFS